MKKSFVKAAVVSLLAVGVLAAPKKAYASNDKGTANVTTVVEARANEQQAREDKYHKEWYWNIGDSLPDNATPRYDKYNLLGTVKKGDIVYEGAGFYGLTGHVAIVEGIKYDSKKRTYYVSIIEAITESGVVRSVLDDTRVDARDVAIKRVDGASAQAIDKAVEFCRSQIGKGYKLDMKKNTSADEKDWYCSELVWAGYKNQGIDIETKNILANNPGITPKDIMNCRDLYNIWFDGR